jgi:hypothetical protein
MSRPPSRIAIPCLALLALTATACAPPDEESSEGDEPDDGVAIASDGLHLTIARPAGVPMDFVPTPNGWRHRSCVIRVGEGESVQDDHIEAPDGSRRDFAPCAHPAFDHHGRPMSDGTRRPTVNGWVASLNSTSAGALNYLVANWSVPRSPAARHGQTLYFFPGLEPLATADTILQPVLAWNGFAEGAWSIASWNCCKSGNVFHSTPIKVSAGHALTGTITGSSCKSGVCSTWKVVAKDDTSGKSTSFPTTAFGEKLDWVFGGAMEAYGVDACNELPSSTSARFTSIKVHDTHGHALLPSWSLFRASGLAPDCHGHFGTPSSSGTTSAATLSWKN